MIERKSFEASLENPLQFWGEKSKMEVKALLGDEAAQMVGFDQNNPHHCYDLFFHTLYTVHFIGDDYPSYLRVAAFFHDIGKPYVAQEKQGRLVFYGHAKRSADIAKSVLSELGYTQYEIDLICFFISHHDDFISWVLPTDVYDHSNPYLVEISRKNLLVHIDDTEKKSEYLMKESTQILWLKLLVLCSADALAQSEIVYKDGIVIDSKVHKLNKIKVIEKELMQCNFY